MTTNTPPAVGQKVLLIGKSWSDYPGVQPGDVATITEILGSSNHAVAPNGCPIGSVVEQHGDSYPGRFAARILTAEETTTPRLGDKVRLVSRSWRMYNGAPGDIAEVIHIDSSGAPHTQEYGYIGSTDGYFQGGLEVELVYRALPDQPGQPDQPDQPGQPEQPEQPERPGPDQPDQPGQPEQPEQPERPGPASAATATIATPDASATLVAFIAGAYTAYLDAGISHLDAIQRIAAEVDTATDLEEAANDAAE